MTVLAIDNTTRVTSIDGKYKGQDYSYFTYDIFKCQLCRLLCLSMELNTYYPRPSIALSDTLNSFINKCDVKYHYRVQYLDFREKECTCTFTRMEKYSFKIHYKPTFILLRLSSKSILLFLSKTTWQLKSKTILTRYLQVENISIFSLLLTRRDDIAVSCRPSVSVCPPSVGLRSNVIIKFHNSSSQSKQVSLYMFLFCLAD